MIGLLALIVFTVLAFTTAGRMNKLEQNLKGLRQMFLLGRVQPPPAS
jgi:hypothetical protein